MTASWHSFCDVSDLLPSDSGISVKFSDGRAHLILVEDQSEAYFLRGTVVRKGVVASIPDLTINTWLRNRTVALVGFRIDSRDRLVGEAWIPKAGLTAEEFQLYVRTVAVECDRFEYQLTGKDVE